VFVCRHDSHRYGSHYAGQTPQDSRQRCPLDHSRVQNLIRLCQQALKNGNKESYSFYHNATNRERKLLPSKSFASKVDNLKSTKPSQWWNAVKQVARMVPCTSSDGLHLEGELSELEITNKINSAFLAPTEIFQLLEAVAPYKDDSYVFTMWSLRSWLLRNKKIHVKLLDPTVSLIGSCVSTPKFLSNQ